MIYRIYSVHGTFAESKSQRGALWWQKESPFSEKVLSYLDTERFKIIWEPFMWSGKNRTSERLDSARKLSRALSQENRLNNRVAVIAHSHGGNIANSAARIIGRPDGMAFITVGTPFLHETKQGYSRYIIDMWKPLLMILPVLMLALYLTASIFVSRVISWLISFSSLFLFISIMGNIIAIINPPVSSSWIYKFYGLNDLMEEIRGEENEAQVKNLRDPKIYSSHDEAINSLRAAPLQKIILMTPTLASGLATLIASIAFVVLFCVDPINLFKRLTVASVDKSSVLPIPPVFLWWRPDPLSLSSITRLLIIIVISLALGFATSKIFGAKALSSIFNSIVSYTIVQQAFGRDRHGRISTKEIDSNIPLILSDYSSNNRWKPMPKDFDDELDRITLSSTSKMVQSIRDSLAFSITTGSYSFVDAISTSYSGEELVHCTYFRHQAFPGFIAWILCEFYDFPKGAKYSSLPSDMYNKWWMEIRPASWQRC